MEMTEDDNEATPNKLPSEVIHNVLFFCEQQAQTRSREVCTEWHSILKERCAFNSVPFRETSFLSSANDFEVEQWFTALFEAGVDGKEAFALLKTNRFETIKRLLWFAHHRFLLTPANVAKIAEATKLRREQEAQEVLTASDSSKKYREIFLARHAATFGQVCSGLYCAGMAPAGAVSVGETRHESGVNAENRLPTATGAHPEIQFLTMLWEMETRLNLPTSEIVNHEETLRFYVLALMRSLIDQAVLDEAMWFSISADQRFLAKLKEFNEIVVSFEMHISDRRENLKAIEPWIQPENAQAFAKAFANLALITKNKQVDDTSRAAYALMRANEVDYFLNFFYPRFVEKLLVLPAIDNEMKLTQYEHLAKILYADFALRPRAADAIRRDLAIIMQSLASSGDGVLQDFYPSYLEKLSAIGLGLCDKVLDQMLLSPRAIDLLHGAEFLVANVKRVPKPLDASQARALAAAKTAVVKVLGTEDAQYLSLDEKVMLDSAVSFVEQALACNDFDPRNAKSVVEKILAAVKSSSLSREDSAELFKRIERLL